MQPGSTVEIDIPMGKRGCKLSPIEEPVTPASSRKSLLGKSVSLSLSPTNEDKDKHLLIRTSSLDETSSEDLIEEAVSASDDKILKSSPQKIRHRSAATR